ncbi:hypothetical protein [Rheinheimera sp. MMS21-TC3]|uniref:hypothetical protein n=1 Tax=Rheinheimera sp. MMS21-TC3 TaxID=3072790 RepID=UPI0028C37E43|nr:hypothetical protein [Rheinheimera sp. MMS21-TC3]WNO60582.1 hypothetical protein RDV63_06335 [Rheinheimera sp. MMS21-TC3]
MSRNQRVAFWSLFIGFCFIATISIYPQGAFDNISVIGAFILTIFYLVVGFFIHLFVKTNPKEIDKWFGIL